MTYNVTLIDYISSDSNLEIEDQDTDEKIITEVQDTFKSVESIDDDVTLDCREFMSSKSAAESLTKLSDYFEDHDIVCKYHLNMTEKELVESVLN